MNFEGMKNRLVMKNKQMFVTKQVIYTYFINHRFKTEVSELNYFSGAFLSRKRHRVLSE
jgi:hypothetical protein